MKETVINLRVMDNETLHHFLLTKYKNTIVIITSLVRENWLAALRSPTRAPWCLPALPTFFVVDMLMDCHKLTLQEILSQIHVYELPCSIVE